MDGTDEGRGRAWRRLEGDRVAERRRRAWAALGWRPERGRLRNGHFGCGCCLCKPWKHGLGEARPASELRRACRSGDEELSQPTPGDFD